MPTIAEAFALALQHHQAGNVQQAEQIYRQIIQFDPNHADSLHLLGELAYRAGRHDVAIDHINRAIRLNPTASAYHCNLGVVYQAVGRLNEAVDHFQRALQLTPSFPEVYNNLAVALKDQGRLDDALTCLRRALMLRPDYVDALNNLGITLSEQGKADEAIDSYNQALRIQPSHGGAHNNLGNAYLGLKRLDEAVASFRQAARFQPNDPATYSNLGAALREQGKIDEAIESYRQALRLKPDFEVAHNNLGAALKEQGHLEEAIASYQQALQLRPDYPQALLNLGNLLKEQRQFDQAVPYIEKALRIDPNNVEGYTCLGNVYTDQGMVDEARACYEQALRIRPGNRLRIIVATMLPLIYDSLDHLRSSRQTFIDNIRKLDAEGVRLDLTSEAAQPPFFLCYQGKNDRDLQLALCRLYLPPVAPVCHPEKGTGSESSRCLSPFRGGKLHIGFISAYFKHHTIGRLMQGLMAHLSRDDFVVTVLSSGNPRDPIADSIRKSCDHYIVVPGNLPAARQLIAGQQLDILFYTDIGMDPFTYTLAVSRLAPVQCVTWGHPSTTGLESIDYYLSSELFETADADSHYSEKLVRLKTIPAFAYRPTPPSPLKPRSKFDLPEDCHLYSCLQSLFKIHPEFDAILAGILRADPRGILVISKGHYSHWYHLLQKRFSVTLPDVLDRIRFVDWQHYEDFLNLNAISDVLLDPIYFGGGRTTYESLSMGLPIVTMPTEMLPGRMANGMYRKMGVMDCVADSPQGYIDLAVKLACNADFRSEVRNRITAASGVLFEDMEAVRELERFFKEAVGSRPATGV